tara:strand:- start:573 stop:1121 length:549 start_codon:yes stop_codon:yes gene_type:complete
MHVLAVLKCWQAREAIANVKQQRAVVLRSVSGSSTRGSASCPEGDLDMNNNTSTLIELKLAVIKYHEGDNTDYLHTGIARDACYTSYNSLSYKKGLMSNAISDYETMVLEGRDAGQIKILNMIEKMEVELGHLEERHDADKSVYHIMTDGEEWSPQAKKRPVALKPAFKAKQLAALKKRVAA